MLTFKIPSSGSCVFFFSSKATKHLLKKSHLDAYKAPASASPFLSTEGDETPSKKRHILMSAVTFSTNGLWMQYFTKYWAGYKLTNKKRTSYVYHVEFPHILKELETKAVQFLGRDCIFFFHGFSPSPSLSHNFRSVFIFSVVSLASSLYALSLINVDLISLLFRPLYSRKSVYLSF